MAAKSSQQNDASKQLSEALKRFSRSVELCDDYLRGYYGLKLVGLQDPFRLINLLMMNLRPRPPSSFSVIRRRAPSNLTMMGCRCPTRLHCISSTSLQPESSQKSPADTLLAKRAGEDTMRLRSLPQKRSLRRTLAQQSGDSVMTSSWQAGDTSWRDPALIYL
jgi:hypothetical protein